MRVGAAVRTMGPQSTRETIVACAEAAEQAGLHDVWVPDHVAIPPDDAEGSGGRYLDPLTTLAYLAARTTRIGLGTGVLNLPYRPPLVTAKAVATVQELSGGRLRLGVGVGWMKAEFQALGVPRSARGRLTDEALEFFHRCFESDEVEVNRQRFLFRPRPTRPAIYVGGAPPQALERTVRYGDGWLPMGGDPKKLRKPIEDLRIAAEAAGRNAPEVMLFSALPLDDPSRTAELAEALRDVGVTGIVHGSRYSDAAEFADTAAQLAEQLLPL